MPAEAQTAMSAAKQVPPEEGGPGWWIDPVADANARRMELSRRVGYLETTIRMAIAELEISAKVSAVDARVVRTLRDALEAK